MYDTAITTLQDQLRFNRDGAKELQDQAIQHEQTARRMRDDADKKLAENVEIEKAIAKLRH